MVWDTLSKKRAQSDAGGQFLRLAGDGDHALVAFIGEPVVHYIVWTGESYEEYDQAVHGPRATAKPSMRAAIAVYDLVDRSVKILDMAKSLQASALANVKKFSPEKCAFEITRSGAAGSTSTTYTVMFDHEMTAAELSAIRSAHVPDLASALGITEEAAPATGPTKADVGLPADGDIPF